MIRIRARTSASINTITDLTIYRHTRSIIAMYRSLHDPDKSANFRINKHNYGSDHIQTHLAGVAIARIHAAMAVIFAGTGTP
jgi:hypothetical protein